MSKRKSSTSLRMKSSQDAFINNLSRYNDEEDNNPSKLPIRRIKDLSQKVRDGIHANRGRPVVYAPDENDDIGWVPEKYLNKKR